MTEETPVNKEVIESLITKAELGDSDAMCCLAYCYSEGKGIKQSFEKAVEWFQKAADAGNSAAMFNLAICYEDGVGVAPSDEKAVEYYQKAADLGDADAWFSLALKYLRGEGVKQSFEKEVECYEKAAELGHSGSMYNMALSYKQGEGVEQSLELAIKWFQKAAKLGEHSAMNNLALLYCHGEGVAQSFEKAVEYYQKAADLGNSDSMFNLARCYMHGEGVEQSFERAVEFYEKAAHLGDADAMFSLAIRHRRGEGVEQSDEKAVEYYQKAAELDHFNAMFNLALLIRRGIGCEQNQTKAEELFQRVFDNGDNDALRYIPHPSLKNYVYPALQKFGESQEKQEEVKRAFAAFQDAVIDVMESCEYKEQKAVYHFTRWPAIESILPKKPTEDCRNVIRLYHEDYMNDPSEGMSLQTLIDAKEYDAELHEIAQFMKAILDQRARLTRDASTYMASFTKSSDRLDLWRAYGSDGDGFCLKIDITQADRHMWSQARIDITQADKHIRSQVKIDIESDVDAEPEKAQMYKLYNVKYEESEKREKLEELLTALKPLYELTSSLPPNVLAEIKKTVFYMLGEVVYLFKDEQYSSEKEVRMFQRLSLNEVCIDESDIGKLYKPTGPILFTGKDSEIMIGPKVENPRAVELSIRKRLQINGFGNTDVTHSKVKYR
ncbi:tetratricopeptide repeat protein [Vibrio fluvialis]|uniref:tetratricopeptide repeat protein n=1 Tax=Vibrio fluvialis TaxID=676 RepID=UPI002380689E|nr:tetratricopeptide repeat protein [Vibrio fluvialis]WDY53599.1 tetratricopeptide repeat protein [Vibrio fluvialis]